MLLLIDNYDSFTYNLVHLLGGLQAKTIVRRNDAIEVEEAIAMAPEGIIISPGPGVPDQAGICLDLIHAAAGRIPLLGVCLGHQAIGQAFGGNIIRAPHMMHGKVSAIRHNSSDVFSGLPSPFQATRYHSLIVDREGFPEALEITAETEDGVVMGLRHRTFPIFGVQFHPESIASENGVALMENFLATTRQSQAA